MNTYRIKRAGIRIANIERQRSIMSAQLRVLQLKLDAEKAGLELMKEQQQHRMQRGKKSSAKK